MPMPNYVDFDPAQLVPGERVIAAVGDPWREDWPWERVETVTGRPVGRVLTDHSAYLWNGREIKGWWKWWVYPRRITARYEEDA